MKTSLIALIFAATIFLTACGTAKTETPSQPRIVVEKDPRAQQTEDVAAAHAAALKTANEEFFAIMNPPADAKTKWEVEFNGAAPLQAVCDLHASYQALNGFINAHGASAEVSMANIDNSSTAAPERKKRGIAYLAALLKFLKDNPVPSCLKREGDVPDEEIIERIPAALVSLDATPEEVGMTPLEIRTLYIHALKKSTPALLADYRSTPKNSDDNRRDLAIQQLCRLVQEKHLTATDLGIPASDYTKFAAAGATSGEGGRYCLPGECPADAR
jgi:hypothetical protein